MWYVLFMFVLRKCNYIFISIDISRRMKLGGFNLSNVLNSIFFIEKKERLVRELLDRIEM